MTQGKRKPAKAAPRKQEAAPRKQGAAPGKNGQARAAAAGGRASKSNQPARTKRQAKSPVRAATQKAAKRIVEARDVALQAVTDTAGEVGSRARGAASATAGFLSANAVPLALLGLGTGWLALAVQRRRRIHQAVMDSVAPPPESSSESSQLLERGREKLASLGDRASRLGDRALELSHDARDGLLAAGQSTREFAKEHPLAATAMAVAAGVGIAMAIPDSKLERTLLGSTREKLADDARTLFDEVASGVRSAIETAVEAKDNLVASVR
jgi:hypothetical protein